jgi:hypothetical protein
MVPSQEVLKLACVDLQRVEVTSSCGEVNHLIGRLLGKARPTIDLAHDDLSGSQQGPEEHGGGFRAGQDGLGFDPALELLVQTLDGVRRSDRFPLALREAYGGKRVKVNRRSPASSRLSATHAFRLRRALEKLAAAEGEVGPIIRSYRGGRLKANSVVNWFLAPFKELGFERCSSHSGRRSFITVAARNVHRSGCSLRDAQMLAGHRSIETTERYIHGDTCGQRKLVGFV